MSESHRHRFGRLRSKTKYDATCAAQQRGKRRRVECRLEAKLAQLRSRRHDHDQQRGRREWRGLELEDAEVLNYEVKGREHALATCIELVGASLRVQ